MAFHGFVYVHRMETGCIETSQPHIPDNDQFEFISDLTVRGKLGIREAGAREVQAPAMIQTPAQG